MIGNSPRNAAIMDVLMNCLNQIFSEDLYPAEAARLSFSLYVNDSGLVLRVDGFDHKLIHLFEQMLGKIVNFSANESLFDSMKNHLFKSYYNALIKPGKLCKDIRLAIMHHTHWSIVDKRIALRDVSREDLLDFSRTFLSNIFFVGLIQGNFTVEEALSLNIMVRKKTNAVPLKPDCFPKLQATKIPEGETFCCVSSFNTTDPNSVVVNYYQSGPGEIKISCLMELLLSIMDEPCFDMLRTKETLGYDVSCSHRYNYGIIGFAVSVKSPGNKFSCSYIDQRIDAFLEAFAVKLQDLSEEEFYVQRASVIDLKKCDDLNLREEVDRNWTEILDRNYLFDRLHKEIECLQSLTLAELKCFGQEHLSSNKNRVRKLGVQVVGSSGIFPNTSFKNLNESTHKGNAGGDEVFNLHFLRPSDSDQSFINDVVEYKKGLELYEYCKIIS